MKTLIRITLPALLPSFLYACALPNLPKIARADQKEIRSVRIVEKHDFIATDFSLPTNPVSGAITHGLAGLGGGMLLGFGASLSAPHPFVAAGAAVVGGVIGLPLGIKLGLACGTAVAEAGIEDPPAHVNRLFETVDGQNFRRALEARLQQLKPGVLDPSTVAFADTVLELQKVTIVIGQRKSGSRDSFSSSSCPPGLSGRAKWRALKSADHTVLGDTTIGRDRPHLRASKFGCKTRTRCGWTSACCSTSWEVESQMSCWAEPHRRHEISRNVMSNGVALSGSEPGPEQFALLYDSVVHAWPTR